MISKKIFLITLIAVMIMGLSVVSAEDTTNNDASSYTGTDLSSQETSCNIETDTIKDDSTIKTINKSRSTGNKKESQTRVTNYAELYDNLTSENAATDTTIILEGDETYTLTDSITLSEKIKNLLIEGNGKIIDGNDNYQFLSVQTPCNIVINNLTIKNCNPSSPYGGAIYQEEGNLTINNTLFEENKAENAGGAVYINIAESVKFYNSTFNHNYASNNGGAVYINNYDGIVKIHDCLFDSNGYIDDDTCSENGGAVSIVNEGTVSVNNTRYINNNARQAGALYCTNSMTGNLIINNTLFDSNGNLTYTSYTSYGGAVNLVNEGNVSIANSRLIFNKAGDGGALYCSNTMTGNLTITGTLFDSNGVLKGYPNTNYGGSIYLYNDANVYIYDSIFTNCNAYQGAGIYSPRDSQGNIVVNNSSFSSNCGYTGLAISTENDNVNITYCNFTDNQYILEINGELEGYGGAIFSENSNIMINNSNFKYNGLPDYIDPMYIQEEFYCFGSAIYQKNNILSIDNSNFTENNGACAGGTIYFDQRHSDINQLTINNSLFSNNKIYSGDGSPGKGIIFVNGANTIIDNSEFISNTYEIVTEHDGTYCGVITFNDESDISGNVINSVFLNNTASNFIIKDGKICLNLTTIGDYWESMESIMDDNYIPDFANVTIYLDEKSEGKNYSLVNHTGNVVCVDEFIVPEDAYLIKMVVTQTSQSQYFDKQNFYNNTYYLLLNHDYTLNVNATSPVRWDDNATITGELYYTRSDGSHVVLADKEVNLYINGTYIATTSTNALGEYEFNYTCRVLGTQEVLVTFNGTRYLPKFGNTTNFSVIKRESRLTVNATNIKIGESSRITFNLTDNEGKAIGDADITYYLDNKEEHVTTNHNGTAIIESKINITGYNYILAIYEGDYGYNGSIDSAILYVDKLNTTISITATNTTINGMTSIRAILRNENGAKICDAQVTVIINADTIIKKTDTAGEILFTYPATLADENHVTIIYEGNDMYRDCFNKTVFYVAKYNTSITVTAQNVSVGEKSSITGKLCESDKQALSNAIVILYIEDEKINLTTDRNGEFIYTYTTRFTGDNYVEVFYEGNRTYNDSTSQSIFHVSKKNTIITVTATNTTLNSSARITGTLYDTNKEKLADKNITIIVNTDVIKSRTDSNALFTLSYPARLVGENHVTVTFPGNDIYTDSLNVTSFTVRKINTRINVTATNTLVDSNTIISGILADENGNMVCGADISIFYDGQKIADGVTDKNGEYSYKYLTKNAGNHEITVLFSEDVMYNPSNSSTMIKVTKTDALVSVDSVNGIIGENITLTAHIIDKNNNPVSGGNLVFKLNGKTLRVDGRFDSNAGAWKFNVVNGIVKVNINADLYLRNTKNLTASYSGSYKYEEAKSSIVTAQIKKRNAQLTLNVSPKSQKQYNTITFKAEVKDITKNHANKTSINTDTYVIFKVNGKTIKDTNGNNLLVKVINGSATYNYTIPAGMGGITKNGKIRDYNVEAVLVSNTYYPDTRDNNTFNVERSSTSIRINKVTVNSNNQLTVNARIKDYKNRKVMGNSTVAIKINGKTYVNPKTGKTENFKVTNGKIRLGNIQVSKDITVKKVMIVTGARQAYLGQRNETINIVKA